MQILPRYLIIALIVSWSIRASAVDRPNILFIYTDDQSYKTLSCYPESPEWVHTPNIDALAHRGIRFHRSYLGSWCMPSRASLLTGRLQHGIQTMRMVGKYPGSDYDPARCRFWPSVLREHGYQTAQIGKWHTGVDTGYQRDWDHQIVWNRPAHPENARNYFYDQLVTFNGEDRRVPGYSTDNYTEWAIEYINGQNRDPNKPWYLWLCYGAVHGPTTPAERHLGSLAGNVAPRPADILGPWPHKPSYLAAKCAWMRGDDGEIVRRRRKKNATDPNTNRAGKPFDDWVQQNNECVLAIDENVGKLVAALHESGQSENTLVVYAADQGYSLGEHGLNQKVAAYDAAISSPMIISHPGSIPTGKVCRQPVNAPDLVRLFCDTAKVKLPWRTDGRDIRPLLANPETVGWTQPMLMTHTGRKYGDDTFPLPVDGPLFEASGVPWYVLLRNANYKYIRTLKSGEPEELYDLDADPDELVNLAVAPSYQQLLAKLRDQAVQELKRSEAKFADSLPGLQ